MIEHKITLDMSPLPYETSIAIGFFDGIHAGHQKLIKECMNSFYRRGIITFSSDMKATIRNKAIELLLVAEERREVLESTGIDDVYVLDFNDKVRYTPKEEFLDFLVTKMRVRKIVVGDDFCFSRNREGTVKDLLQLRNKGIEVTIIPTDGKEKISTTEIKEEIHEGRIEDANKNLGYPFFVTGIVNHGYENGRKLGFPTANIEYPFLKCKLPDGVYKTRTTIEGRVYKSMTNIGNHPTIDILNKDIIETNIIGLNEDLYGKKIKVEFLSFLRPQVKFASLEELISQLEKDKKKAAED